MGGPSSGTRPNLTTEEELKAAGDQLRRHIRREPIVIDSVLGPGEVPRPSPGFYWWAALAIAPALFALVVVLT